MIAETNKTFNSGQRVSDSVGLPNKFPSAAAVAGLQYT